ncbi:MAG: hypothetical protein FWG66_07285 [Spirochaetes bacterium]|nr:hypothetical protein [Spirochaetota bacterium]
MKAKFIGNCYLCGESFTKITMKTHLRLHNEKKGDEECRLLKIEGIHDKCYWLYIDVPVDKTLSVVDAFLRKIWLECCGHMSMFYSGDEKIAASSKLEKFNTGDKFFHNYDFGNTTTTQVTIMGNITRKQQKSPVRLLARNAPPILRCADCETPAKFICMEPDDNDNFPFYCGKCIKNHPKKTMFYITNSPRMGACSYTGEEDTFAFNPANILPEGCFTKKSKSAIIER